MKMSGPEEDPADRRARMRERQITQRERADVGMESARSYTTDLMSVYGIENGRNAFRGPKPAPRVKRPNVGSMSLGMR